MTSLAEVCAELRRWLPAAAILLAEPDANGSTGTGQPDSSPPWNSSVANALYDAHGLIRDTRLIFMLVVSGHVPEPVSWSDRSTMAALDTIERFGHAMPQDHAREKGKPCRCHYCAAISDLSHCATQILQLAGIDLEDHPKRIPSPCPYCPSSMLMARVRERQVTCLKADCTDSDGNHPIGRMGYSPVDQVTPVIEWADGLVT